MAWFGVTYSEQVSSGSTPIYHLLSHHHHHSYHLMIEWVSSASPLAIFMDVIWHVSSSFILFDISPNWSHSLVASLGCWPFIKERLVPAHLILAAVSFCILGWWDPRSPELFFFSFFLSLIIENRLVDTEQEGEGGMNWESSTETYASPFVRSIANGSVCITQGAPCGPLWQPGGWDWVGSEREVQEGGDICILMTDSRCHTAEANTIL